MGLVFDAQDCICTHFPSAHDDGFGCTEQGCACLAGWSFDDLFDDLTAQERTTLISKMTSAAVQFRAEYDRLYRTPASVLAGYGISPETGVLVTDWLMAATDIAPIIRELVRT